MNYQPSLRRILFLTIMFISHEGYAAYYTRLGRRAILPTPFTGPMKTPSVKPSLPTSIGMRTFSQTETRQLSTYRPSFWNKVSGSMQQALNKVGMCEQPGFKLQLPSSDDLAEKGPALLYEAVKRKDNDLAKALMQMGVNPTVSPFKQKGLYNEINDDDSLIIAYKTGNRDLIMYMIKNGLLKYAYENIYSGRRTPLHMAIDLGDIKIVRAMLEDGAHWMGDNYAISYLENALRQSKWDIAKIFVNQPGNYINQWSMGGANPEPTLLRAAIRENNIPMFDWLIKNGANVNDSNPIYLAVGTIVHPYFVQRLLEKEAKFEENLVQLALKTGKVALAKKLAQILHDSAVKRASIEDLD